MFRSLLVHGSDDPFVSGSDHADPGCPHARKPRSSRLSGVGHWPSLEAPDELRAELVRFCEL